MPPALRRLSPALLIIAGWTIVLAVAMAQDAVVAVFRHRPLDPALSLAVYGPYVVLWALATPFVARLVAHRPVRGAAWWRHALLHLAVGAAFIIGTNALMRVPLLAEGVSAFAASLGLGLTVFGPVALLAWGALVGLLHGWMPAATADRLPVRDGRRLALLAPDEIRWVEARDNYVRVHRRSGAQVLRCRISELERRLDPARFARIHRSAIVAVADVREVRTAARGGAEVVLSAGERLRVARARREALEAAVARYGALGRYSAAR